MKTVQIAPVRTLMTALKDILLETNIIFNQEYTDSSGKLIPAGTGFYAEKDEIESNLELELAEAMEGTEVSEE